MTCFTVELAHLVKTGGSYLTLTSRRLSDNGSGFHSSHNWSISYSMLSFEFKLFKGQFRLYQRSILLTSEYNMARLSGSKWDRILQATRQWALPRFTANKNILSSQYLYFGDMMKYTRGWTPFVSKRAQDCLTSSVSCSTEAFFLDQL